MQEHAPRFCARAAQSSTRFRRSVPVRAKKRRKPEGSHASDIAVLLFAVRVTINDALKCEN
jgi:hypothetical protein